MTLMTEAKSKYQKEYRAQNNNTCTRKYEKTRSGFLVRLYRNMKSRVAGVNKNKAHLYKGKYLLGKEEFYAWSNSSIAFAALFNTWELSNYDRKLTPSVDRISSEGGYSLDNMEWVPFTENCRRGGHNRYKNINKEIT